MLDGNKFYSRKIKQGMEIGNLKGGVEQLMCWITSEGLIEKMTLE